MPAKTILIIANETGVIDLGSDESCKTKNGKSIAWQCNHPLLEQLTISFNKAAGTPFKNQEATFQSSRPGHQTNVGVVKPHLQTGASYSVGYDYNISVKLRGSAEFHRDPQVVVDVDSAYRVERFSYEGAVAFVAGVTLAIWGLKQLALDRNPKVK